MGEPEIQDININVLAAEGQALLDGLSLLLLDKFEDLKLKGILRFLLKLSILGLLYLG